MNNGSRAVAYLKARPGRIISYEELYEAVWEVPPSEGFRNTLQATVCMARRNLKVGQIYSVRDLGYIFKEVV